MKRHTRKDACFLHKAAVCGFTLAFFMLLFPLAVSAATGATPATAHFEMANPLTALLSPNGGRLHVAAHIPLKKIGGNSVAEFIIPGDSSNLQLDAPDNKIIRWDSVPFVIQPSSEHAQRRASVENERINLSSKLISVQARLAVWQAQTSQASAQELSQRQNLMAEQMPALAREQEELKRSLSRVEQELAQLPRPDSLAKLVTVTVAGEHDKSLSLNYSYDLASCGWQPIYEFNARPDTKDGDVIDVRMLAEVWQFTGMDWKDTRITLATLGYGPREPQALPRWVVGQPATQPAPQPRAAGAAKNVKSAAPVAEHAMLRAAPAYDLEAPLVNADTDSLYASWELTERGLPEGRFHMQIATDSWKTPLQWLARPSAGDNRVWLLCKYDLPQTSAWPAGMAQFSVDGQNMGNGVFRPKSGNAELFFGADPRVSVHTTIDSSKQGETGFINTSKTWTGAWTYTITNQHDKAIKVKVERPAPMVANENITVSYKDNPKAQVDDKEHMVFWNVDVPAHGKSVIEHSVTISSPEKLPLLPDVP